MAPSGRGHSAPSRLSPGPGDTAAGMASARPSTRDWKRRGGAGFGMFVLEPRLWRFSWSFGLWLHCVVLDVGQLPPPAAREGFTGFEVEVDPSQVGARRAAGFWSSRRTAPFRRLTEWRWLAREALVDQRRNAGEPRAGSEPAVGSDQHPDRYVDNVMLPEIDQRGAH